MRLVDQYCNGDPTALGIEGNIALFATFLWDGERLAYASIPVLVAECSLDEYYLDDAASATYFRLDMNYETLGEPFSHPLPHIHMGDAESSRFALDGGTSGNVIVDFLEFVYRNHVPAKFLHWARRLWLSDHEDEQSIGQFDRIVQAFRDLQFNVLRANAHIILQIKRTLRDAKDSLFKAHMDGADRTILEYPLAR